MTNEKRARQKANRANRVAAAEAAAAKARMRSRLITYGTVVAAVVLAIVGFAVLTADDDEPTVSDTGADGDPGAVPETTPPTTVTTVPPPVTEPPSDTMPAIDECPAEDGSSPRAIDFEGPLPDCIDFDANYTAVFDTTEGEIRVELDVENTPNTVNNFVTLARWGYYDGTTIFRTDPSIDIIQGGSPHTQTNSDPGPGYTIPDEPEFDDANGALVGPYTYEPGQLVMARSGGPDASGAQYFFVTGPLAANLNSQGTYIVFGNADADGLSVTQDIIGLHGINPGTGQPGPSRDVWVTSVTIEES